MQTLNFHEERNGEICQIKNNILDYVQATNCSVSDHLSL